MILPRLHLVIGVRENRDAEAIYIGNDAGKARDLFMAAGDDGFAVALIYHYPMPNRTKRFKNLASKPGKPLVKSSTAQKADAKAKAIADAKEKAEKAASDAKAEARKAAADSTEPATEAPADQL